MLSQSNRIRAQESRAAVQRLYIAMRHLFIRGSYKPLGLSGEAIIEAMMVLRPEIYGSISDPEKVELNGLFYVAQRLPRGIEECRFIRLISREGFEQSNFEPIIPPKRRRQAYRIDDEQMFIEMTRGRSDIYDILTHLTFLYIEAEKIRRNSTDHKGRRKREWEMLEEIVEHEKMGEEYNREVAFTYLSTLLGRTYAETVDACRRFNDTAEVNSIFHITYWLGRLSLEEAERELDREITFSSALREKIGHHYYGDFWARNIKKYIYENQLYQRPIHIISANLHSVMNSLYAPAALHKKRKYQSLEDLAEILSLDENDHLREVVKAYAHKNGMIQIDDVTGTNISVQIFDTTKLGTHTFTGDIRRDVTYLEKEKPLILVMDYAFGEQAFESMDELLKPYETDTGEEICIQVESISIMGKAGILEGGKGDLMVPTAHIFEGTADNYPFENEIRTEDLEGHGLQVFCGPMISVLGTSLQNRDILQYFNSTSWKAIGLEMEGAHYQKAIQSAAKIRHNIRSDVKLAYAYYASDNPLETGSTLASGSLGVSGVKPTYLITRVFLEKILQPTRQTAAETTE
jgi:hypothetical protein